MKKSGFIEKIVKAGIVAASVGGTLYLLKDKIEENPKCKEAIDKVKEMIKKQEPTENADDFFDMNFDTDLNDASLDELINSLDNEADAKPAKSSKRGYVTIKLHDDEDPEEILEETTSDYSEAE